MRSAAPWLTCAAAALLLAAGSFVRADDRVRAAPRRPGAPASAPAAAPAPAPAKPAAAARERERAPSQRYVSVPDLAKRLGLKFTQTAPRQWRLTRGTTKIELETDSREITVDGLRLFLGAAAVIRDGELHLNQFDADRTVGPLARPDILKVRPDKPKVIALDPGHGGVDNGMENKELGLKEKVLTLDVAQRLKKILTARGYKVVLTRNDDRQLGPDKASDFLRRSQIANAASADLLVSIHFNSLYPDTKTSGTEVYTFTPQFQRSTRALSAGEQDDTEREPAPVNRYDGWSAILAHAIHREVIASLKTSDRGQKTMHSAVLRGLNCPGVLVEAVFLSNPAEGKKAATAAYRQQMAEAIAAGIDDYAGVVGNK
ncbi:MAG: N-acetylmuramoyl-L-alanine amidase [Verrucomicrobia bacterium]|nr:N-acetylmuramoyl-L-alanine amidase [Verrucomicrobiota bacterium]